MLQKLGPSLLLTVSTNCGSARARPKGLKDGWKIGGDDGYRSDEKVLAVFFLARFQCTSDRPIQREMAMMMMMIGSAPLASGVSPILVPFDNTVLVWTLTSLGRLFLLGVEALVPRLAFCCRVRNVSLSLLPAVPHWLCAFSIFYFVNIFFFNYIFGNENVFFFFLSWNPLPLGLAAAAALSFVLRSVPFRTLF